MNWLAALLSRTTPTVLVTVLRAEGSVPRGAGTRMLVDSRAQFDTIGGGHLELKAVEKARELLHTNRPAHEERFALGPTLGQCCGGVVWLAFERIEPSDAERIDGLRREAEAVQRDWPLLLLFGAGHVGAALVRALAELPCHVQWIDTRDAQFPSTMPHNVTIECTDTPEAAIAAAPSGATYLVMTHSHALDQALTEEILQRDDVAWFGLIGSQTKRVSFERRMRERGIDEARIRGMACPIGLPGITGKEPAVIAAAVCAQLLQIWEALASAKHKEFEGT